MRKLFWAVFIVLVFALGGCDAFAPPGNFEYDPDDVTYTDVVYSPDGSSVTIYLEGGVAVPNRQRRALSKELAIAGHDFFEVAFYYQDGANPGGANDVVARASWELMKDAQIRNVKGKDTGSVNYSKEAVFDVEIWPNQEIGRDPNNDPIYGDVEVVLPNLSPGEGAAILFVGRKTDKTLLGVGKLDSTTNIDGSPGTLSITPNTKTVTFAVAALECGLSPTAGLNSFWTNYHGNAINQTNTERNEIEMGDYHYYMYELQDKENGGVTSSEYTFRTSAGSFNDYRRGIILAGPGAYEKRQPRYPTPDGQFQYFSVMLDDQTIITSGSNTAPNVGKPFINPVEMTFNTAYTVGGSIFALAFQIPVCPLYLDEEGGTWYIRASYDSYWLDLDDAGLDGRPRGSGGAIMFRTGKISGFSAYRIRVVAPPNKYLYSYNNNGPLPYPAWAGNPNSNLTDMSPVNRFFNVNGLVVVLEYAHNSEFIRYLNNTELGFEIGMKAIRPRVGNIPGEYLPLTVYGLQTVKVIYIEEGIPHESQFFIIVDNPVREFTGIPLDGNPVNSARPPDVNQPATGPGSYIPANSDVFPGSGIPMRNFIVVNDAVRPNLQDYLSTRMNYAKTVCTFVIIFDGENSTNWNIDYSFTSDLQPSNPNNTPNLLITLAARNTGSGNYFAAQNNAVHVGRGAGTLANGVYRAGSTANSFYFGRWPFNDYLYGVPAAADYHNLGAVARYDYVDTIVIPPDPPGTTRMIHRTYSYSLDAYGPAANGGVDSPPGAGNPTSGGGLSNKYFINDIQGGRFYNVRAFLVGEDPANGILLYNRRWLN